MFAALNANVSVALNDENGYAMLIKCTVGNIPSSVAGYAEGCVLIATDAGSLYMNTGSNSSCTFTLNGTGASGYSGYSGTSGTSGFSGKSGFSGTSGTSGTP
jgi:hypothetical protein